VTQIATPAHQSGSPWSTRRQTSWIERLHATQVTRVTPQRWVRSGPDPRPCPGPAGLPCPSCIRMHMQPTRARLLFRGLREMTSKVIPATLCCISGSMSKPSSLVPSRCGNPAFFQRFFRSLCMYLSAPVTILAYSRRQVVKSLNLPFTGVVIYFDKKTLHSTPVYKV